MMKARRISRISFTASNLAQAEDFYAQLGFETVRREAVRDQDLALLGLPRSWAERLVMRIGGQEVEFLSFDPPGRPYPPGSTATDGWFQHIAIVVTTWRKPMNGSSSLARPRSPPAHLSGCRPTPGR